MAASLARNSLALGPSDEPDDTLEAHVKLMSCATSGEGREKEKFPLDTTQFLLVTAFVIYSSLFLSPSGFIFSYRQVMCVTSDVL